VGPGGVFLEGDVGSRGMDMIPNYVKIKLFENRATHLETMRLTSTCNEIIRNSAQVGSQRGVTVFFVSEAR
jgi:hypothetical protein